MTGEDQVDTRGGGVSAPLRRYDERAQRLPAALAAGPGQDGQDIDVVGAVAASPGEFAGAASPAVGRGQVVMALWRRVNGKPSWAVWRRLVIQWLPRSMVRILTTPCGSPRGPSVADGLNW